MSELQHHTPEHSSFRRGQAQAVKKTLQGKSWAITLSGGGVRGVAHLGVLQAFEEERLFPQALSGSSSGALVAALYAAGKSPKEIFSKVDTTRWWRTIRLAGSWRGLLSTSAFVKPFRAWLPDTFESLEKPLYLNTMDLATGETVVFSQGELLPALQASMAIPMLCKPVCWQRRWLYDGGLLNNLPIEPLEGKYDHLVGVHTNFIGTEGAQPPKSWRSMLERIFQLSIAQNARAKQDRCTVWIEPPTLGKYRVFEFNKAAEIFEEGYAYTKHLLI